MESVIDNLKQIVKCTSGLVYCPSILIDAAIREIERLRAERDALKTALRKIVDTSPFNGGHIQQIARDALRGEE